ncbi:unnamed protein product [Acanthoscelides obtectus]|uniref:Uncharacterized protein n=1 Tax=Acanthoscelides obtectus TaxID=200917 RepID=A0A9P0K1I9_ACAOB|nr:unnamed protein product [Acanthoscelides obtectus]CAK1646183.1 hypothetical protein AOBTE_LOCUS14501 [Acanthoscelides obtectus]
MAIVVSKKLNFTINLVESNSTNRNLSYTKRLLYKLQTRDIDMAIGGCTLNYDSMEIAEFGTYIMHERFIAVFNKEHTMLPDNLSAVYNQLTCSLLMLMVVLSIITIALVVRAVIKVFSQEKISYFSLLSIQDADYAFLNSTACGPKTPFCRVLHSKNHLTPYDINQPCEVIRSLISEKYSMILEKSELLYLVKSNYCNFPMGWYTKLRYIRLNIGGGFQTWMFQKSAPYTKQLSILILRLQQSGLIKFWIDEQRPARDVFDGKESSIRKALTMTQLRHPFCILLVGYISSVLIFLCEKFICWCKRRQTPLL